MAELQRESYKKRLIDAEVERQLAHFGAVCIEGPKWCGKTWTSSYHAASAFMIGDPAGNFQNRTLAQTSPEITLAGEAPRLIDEWQEVPSIWDAVRFEVDRRGKKGQFLLTGSSTPKTKGVMHSGAGRISRLSMRTMTLYESGESSGKVSLKELCEGRLEPALTGEVDLRDLILYVVRGGWPGNLDAGAADAQLVPSAYLEAILADDTQRIDGVRYDRNRMHLLLRSLARNESTTVSTGRLLADIAEVDHDTIDRDTVAVYLDVFRRLFLISDQPPFAGNIRSSIRVKKAPKRHFCDPAIACALLRATPEMLLADLNTFGFLFEALCERDLAVYAASFGAKLYHYQDYSNREVDAVVELQNGDWCAIEIKLGANQIDSAAKALVDLRNSIEADPNGKPPKTLCVICGMSNAAYVRPDGVFVVPITALKN